MATLRIVSQQNRVFKGPMKIAALSIASKTPVLSLSSVRPELLYRTMFSGGGRVISFFTIDLGGQITSLLLQFPFLYHHPSELLTFTKTGDCTLPVFK